MPSALALCGFSNIIVGEPTEVRDITLLCTCFHMDCKSIASYSFFCLIQYIEFVMIFFLSLNGFCDNDLKSFGMGLALIT